MNLSWVYNYENWLYKNWYPFRAISPLIGYDQTKAQLQSNKAQIDYDTYLREGNLRAYNDWQNHVGSKGRSIRYPELSYPGAIYRADTGLARTGYSNDIAYSNNYRGFVYGTAGLYGVASRASRII